MIKKEEIAALNVGAKIRLVTGEEAEVLGVDRGNEILSFKYVVSYAAPKTDPILVKDILPPPPVGGLGAPFNDDIHPINDWPPTIPAAATIRVFAEEPDIDGPKETTIKGKWSDLVNVVVELV